MLNFNKGTKDRKTYSHLNHMLQFTNFKNVVAESVVIHI